MQKVGKKLLRWDESDVFDSEIEYRAEEHWEDYVTEDEMKTWDLDKKKEYLRMKLSDIDMSFYWDNLLAELNDILTKKNKQGGYWKASVENFGWRKLSGKKLFRAETAREFLDQILPKCDCTFNIFNYGKGLAIQNSHHDSPTGNEFYYVMPTSPRTYEKERSA